MQTTHGLRHSIWFLGWITSWSRMPEEYRSQLLIDARLLQHENRRHLRTKMSRWRGQGEQVLEHFPGQIWQLQRTGSSLGSRSRVKVLRASVRGSRRPAAPLMSLL